MGTSNLQVIHKETDVLVASVVINDELVSTEGLQAFADAVRAVAEARSGEPHYVGLKDTAARYKDIRMQVDHTKAHNVGKKQRGICPRCKKVIALDKDGLMYKHGKAYGERGDKRCAGTGKRPLSAKGARLTVVGNDG